MEKLKSFFKNLLPASMIALALAVTTPTLAGQSDVPSTSNETDQAECRQSCWIDVALSRQ